MTSKAFGLAQLGNAFNDGALSNRNLIINGAMQVAQRGTSATSVSTEGYKTVDRFRWTMDTTSAVFTLSQSTDAPSGQGFSKSFKAETTTADGTLDANNQTRFEYRFEGQDLQQLAKGTSDAKQVTLSFWVKSYQTGTYAVNLQDTDNNRLIAATYTVNSSATWEYKTITFAGDTSGALTNDNNLSVVVHWYLGAGSNYTSGTLATSWESLTNANRAVGQTVDIASSTSNYWQITGVQLEAGDTATPFEHRSYGQELALCQRYYQVVDVNGTVSFRWAAGYGNTGNMAFLLPTPMRSSASFTSLTTLTSRNLYNQATDSNVTSGGMTASLSIGRPTAIQIFVGSVSGSLGGSGGDPFIIGGGSETLFAFDAEL